ncbi:hypothetical protein LIA77_00132 [Sarocladium implicatum]|nr:hypothetical protein LIA77_00132 [Sarocladium implicatum]
MRFSAILVPLLSFTTVNALWCNCIIADEDTDACCAQAGQPTFYAIFHGRSDPKEAYDWRTLCNPAPESDDEDGFDDEEEDDDTDGGSENPKSACDGGETCPCHKTPKEFPDHPYILTHATTYKQHLTRSMLTLCDPDGFGMYTYNGHASYGALEVAQNLLIDFDDAYRANNLREAWVNVETLAMYFTFSGGDMMSMADDGQRIQETAELIAKVPLAALAAIWAQPESENKWEPKNYGWIMALYIQLTSLFSDASLLEPPASKAKGQTFKWDPSKLDDYLKALAIKHDIKLVDIDEAEVDEAKDTQLPDLDKKDPWGWAKSFTAYKKGVEIGGDSLDVTSWTPAERKKAAFDGKDPLPAADMKNIREGLVMMLG